MKSFIFSLLMISAISFSAQSCPYQKMAEVDTKLYSEKNISSQTFAKISNFKITR